MKKFLSLALALVMALSLVTISAGAKEFKDDSSITYEEAVAVVSEIGVVDGYSDGNFNPQNVLTRGAAAKIICNLILGPTTASALSADAAPFKDVPANHEFAGYIAYCAQQGIINGYSDGTFRPAGTLNGYSFMKMLLGALNYDGSIEGFTGPNWTINVAKLALGVGLDSGNDEFNGAADVTREEACLYAFNTLKADMVEYDSKTSVNVGGAEVVISGSKAKPVSIANGWVGTNDGNIDDDNVQQFAEKYFDKLTKTTKSHDAFGRPAAEWKYKSNIIGTYTDYSDLIGSWTAKAKKGELYSLIGSSIIDDLNTKKEGYEFSVWVDGTEDQAPAKATYFDKNSTAAAGVSGNGVLTQAFMDDDNNVTIVMINTYLVKATADYNSSKEQVTVETVDINSNSDAKLPNLPTTIDQDDFDVENVKEDDYLLVTYSYDSEDIESVEPAELKTGTVSQYTITDNVVIDGTTYKYNKIVGTKEKETEYSINQDASVVLDAYGYILYIDEAISSNSYVYIREFGSQSGLASTAKAVANAYFADGTNAEITIKKVNGVDSKSTIAGYKTSDTYCKWYTYTVNGNNEYTLTDVSGKRTTDCGRNTAAITGSTNGTQIVFGEKVKFMDSTVGGLKSTVKADDSTIFVTLDADDDINVYTGIDNAPDVYVADDANVAANAIKIAWVEKDGYATFVFIDVSKDGSSSVDGSSANDYLFVLKQNASNNKTVVDGSEYWNYDVIVDGEKTTRYIDASNVAMTGALYYNIQENSDGYVTKVTEVGGKSTHNVINLNGKTITKSGSTLDVAGNEYIVTGSTELYLILGKGCELLKDSGADYETYLKTTIGTLAGVVNDYKLTGTAYAVVDEAGSEKLEVLYVYVTGAEDTTAPVTPVEPEEPEVPEQITVTVKATVNLGNGVTDTLDDTIMKFATPEEDGAKVAVAAPKFDGYTPVIDRKNVTYVEGTYAYEVSFTYTRAAATSPETPAAGE